MRLSLGAKPRKLQVEEEGKLWRVESGEGSWLGKSEKGLWVSQQNDSVAAVLAEAKGCFFLFSFFSRLHFIMLL